MRYSRRHEFLVGDSFWSASCHSEFIEEWHKLAPPFDKLRVTAKQKIKLRHYLNFEVQSAIFIGKMITFGKISDMGKHRSRRN